MQRIDEVYESLKERVFEAEFKPNEMISAKSASATASAASRRAKRCTACAMKGI